jgi:DNA-binding HTH domain-containing proteins
MIAADLLTFSEGCQRLYAPGLSLKNYAARGIRFVRNLIAGEFAGCGLHERRTGRLSVGLDVPHPAFDSAMDAYGALMGNYALFNFDPSVNDGRPFRRSQFYCDRAFRRLDIYNEVFRPLGVDNHCALHVPTRDDESLFFFVERRGGPDFSDRDLALLSLAQSHLRTAYVLGRSAAEYTERKVDAERLVHAGLTPREADTLVWICQGKSNAEIALILGISLHTVKDHVAAIFDKAGVGNRVAAIVWARRVCSQTDGASGLFTETQAHLTVPASPSEVG